MELWVQGNTFTISLGEVSSVAGETLINIKSKMKVHSRFMLSIQFSKPVPCFLSLVPEVTGFNFE